MSVYRRYFDKTKCMYFLKKDEYFFVNIMKFGKNLAILLKKINRELIYNK